MRTGLTIAFGAFLTIAQGMLTIPQASAAEGGIARLNYAGLRDRSHCTASLIGPSTVLTARHCIEGKPVSALRVVFGYQRGEWVELRNVKSTHPHEDQDIALLCLDRKSAQKPLRLGEPAKGVFGAEVTGYRRSRAHLPTTLACKAQAGKTRLRMECPVEPGMSGSPVRADGAIVAVMARTSKAFSIAERVNDLPESTCE